MPGVPELLVILVIVMLIFGAGKLPSIGDALGKSIRNFKKSMKAEEAEERPQIATKKRAELEAADADEEEDEEEVAELEEAEKHRTEG